MCRSIKVLRRNEGMPTEEELFLAARQYIRKISGYPKPSKSNQAAFDKAIEAVVRVTRDMFDVLVVEPPRRTAVNPDGTPVERVAKPPRTYPPKAPKG